MKCSSTSLQHNVTPWLAILGFPLVELSYFLLCHEWTLMTISDRYGIYEHPRESLDGRYSLIPYSPGRAIP